MVEKHPVKVIVSIETKGGKWLNAKVQEIMISNDYTQEEMDEELKQVEELANKKFKKMHLPLVCKMTFQPTEEAKAVG